jgi:hypothetical protein
MRTARCSVGCGRVNAGGEVGGKGISAVAGCCEEYSWNSIGSVWMMYFMTYSNLMMTVTAS